MTLGGKKSLFSLISLLFLVSCSLEEGPLKVISGHTLVYEGIAHGVGAQKAERYCQNCHGPALQGGLLGEPSCFQCHGRNWLSSGADLSFAPADHTVVQDKFSHHPDYQSPLGTCAVSGCHGSQLAGDLGAGTPSCYLCHGAVWE